MTAQLPIYMDYHATTPVDPRVAEAMRPCFAAEFGNPASRSHAYGWRAEELVKDARAKAARLIEAKPEEIVFTSGATEANNLALKGVFEVYREKGDHLITQAAEHKSVLDTCRYLEARGARVTYLGVDKTGRISLEELEKAITAKTVLISVMAANNEIGTLQPVAEIGKIAKKRGVLFHTDAAQMAGKLPLDVNAMGIDLLSITAHKFYGPKGAGALYVRRKDPRVRLAPLLHGGGHEEGLRSGTLNAPGIVGLGKACEIAHEEMADEAKRVGALRDRLKKGIEARLDEVTLNGHPTERLWNNLNLSFACAGSEDLMMALQEDVAVSSGSACSSAKSEPSHVLKALGLREELIHSSIRFGLGRFTTEAEVDRVIECVTVAVKKLREMSPFYQGGKACPST